jgi:CRP-like cAMP-binding protein
MQTIRDLIAEHRFFRDLRETDLDLIAGCGRNVHFRPNTLLFREGEPADTFYVIRQGRVALETHAPPSGGIVVATLGPGDVVGWSWLFPPYLWHFDARAFDETSAIALDGVCLRTKCDEDSDLGYRLMKRFAEIAMQRLQQSRLQILDLYGSPSTS